MQNIYTGIMKKIFLKKLFFIFLNCWQNHEFDAMFNCSMKEKRVAGQKFREKLAAYTSKSDFVSLGWSWALLSQLPLKEASKI